MLKYLWKLLIFAPKFPPTPLDDEMTKSDYEFDGTHNSDQEGTTDEEDYIIGYFVSILHNAKLLFCNFWSSLSQIMAQKIIGG